jgi:hypothetical protein
MMTRRGIAQHFENEFPALAALPWDERAEAWLVAANDGVGVWVAPLMFTSAVIVGPVGDHYYDDRWCYTGPLAALDAARAWGGPWNGGEPTGWHRHPGTGRRREDGDPERETVMP